MSKTEELYYQLGDTPQFIPTGKIIKEKEYPSDVLADDLLGLTDFSSIPDSTVRYYDNGKPSGIKGGVGMFRTPELVLNPPERFEYFGFKDVLEEFRIIKPRAENPHENCDHLEMFHVDFIDELKHLGFTDFRTYPVRVYFIEKYRDIYRNPRSGSTERWSSEEAQKRFDYTDDLYFVFQLTNPRVELFSQDSRERALKIKTNPIVHDLEFRSDVMELELPLLFRARYDSGVLLCNTKAQEHFKKFNTLSFSGGSYFHRRTKGNPVPFAYS
jgi:hypothetical protein